MAGTRLIKSSSYFSHPGVNYSLLKSVKDNPFWTKFKLDNPDTDDSEKGVFRKGGALDTILTQPQNFNKEYGVLTEKRPSGLMGVFIDNLNLSITQESPQEEYYEAYEKSGYKLGLETVIDKLWNTPQNLEYFMGRKRNQGKIILGIDEYDEVLHSQEKLINNPNTCKYFINNNPNEIVLHQLGIEFTVEGTLCKALLDGVFIDLKNKTIRLFDLKSTGKSVYSFPYGNYLIYGYYLQACHYHHALQSVLNDCPEELCKLNAKIPKDIGNFEHLPPIFIVAENKLSRSNPAIIFELTVDDLVSALSGFSVRGRIFKGWMDTLNDYNWHKANNKWDYTRELYESGGVLNLGINYDEEQND